MPKLLHTLPLLFLIACTTAPSDEVFQTAIAQTAPAIAAGAFCSLAPLARYTSPRAAATAFSARTTALWAIWSASALANMSREISRS